MKSDALKAAVEQLRLRKMAAAAAEVPAVQPPVEAAAAEPPVVPAAETAAFGAEGVESQVPQLLDLLVAAYNAEVCSAWQYEWARIAALGKARNYLVSECEKHRDEEWEHAEKLAEMIDFLGGTVPFSLSQIEVQNPTPSPQEDPNGNRDTDILAHQLVEAEEQAVQLYSRIVAMTRGDDPDAAVVNNLAVDIVAMTRGDDPDAAVVNNLAVDILTTEKKHVADMIKVVYAVEQQ